MFEEHRVNVGRVVSELGEEPSGLRFFEAANEKQISGLTSSELHEGLYAYSAQAPDTHVTVTQVDKSLESLPITNQNTQIALHFTQPTQEVLPGGGVPGQVIDVAELDDEHLDYDLQIKVGKTSRVSVSFDVQKVDEVEAAQFLSQVKTYLDDPDMLLL